MSSAFLVFDSCKDGGWSRVFVGSSLSSFWDCRRITAWREKRKSRISSSRIGVNDALTLKVRS